MDMMWRKTHFDSHTFINKCMCSYVCIIYRALYFFTRIEYNASADAIINNIYLNVGAGRDAYALPFGGNAHYSLHRHLLLSLFQIDICIVHNCVDRQQPH